MFICVIYIYKRYFFPIIKLSIIHVIFYILPLVVIIIMNFTLCMYLYVHFLRYIDKSKMYVCLS